MTEAFAARADSAVHLAARPAGGDAHKIIALAPAMQCALSACESFAYPLHVHRTVEGLLVVEGSALLETPSGCTVMESGDLALLWPDEPHSGSALVGAGARFFAVHARPEVVAAAGMCLPDGLAPPIDARLIRGAFGRHRLQEIGCSTCCEELLRAGRCVLEFLAGHLRLKPNVPHIGWLGRLPQLLQSLPDEALSSTHIAAALGLNPRYFATSFKAHFGVSPRDFALARRVERARAALLRGVPLVEVAHTCGFADQAHFSRCFRRAYGVPPQAFRRRNALVRTA